MTTKLKPIESLRAAYLNNMVKVSSPESPLIGSIQLKDVSAKRTDECSSNDNQDGGAKNIQSSIVDCHPSTIRAVQEDSNVDFWMGGKGTNNCNSKSPHTDPWNTPLIQVRKNNEKTKWNTTGSSSWETSKKSKEGDSSMAWKRAGNEFKDGKAKREASVGYGVFDRDRVQGCGKSNIYNKGSLSKSYWNREEDGYEKKNVGCPSRDGARSIDSSKFEYGNRKRGTREYNSFNRYGIDGWMQNKFKINMVENGGLKKSMHWNRSEDCHTKKDGHGVWCKPVKQDNGHQNGGGLNESEDGSGKKGSGGWPSWDGAWSKTIGNSGWKESHGSRRSEEDATVACKRSWNDSEDVKGKRKVSEGGDDRCQQSYTVEKGSLSNLRWEKKEDKKGNKEIDGWSSWGGSMSKTIKDSPSSQNKSAGCSYSLARTGSDHGDFWKEDGGRNSDLDQSEDPWMQKNTVIPSKCDWNKSAGWTSSKGDALERNRWKQSSDLDQAGGDPWKRHCPDQSGDPWMQKSTVIPPKCDWNKSAGCTSLKGDGLERNRWKQSSDLVQTGVDPWKRHCPDQSEDPWTQKSTVIPPKCDWNKSEGWTSSKGDALERNRWKQNSDLVQTGRYPWKRHCPYKLQKNCRDRSGSWAAPKKSCFRKKHEWSGDPQFCNPDSSKQHGSRFGSGSGSDQSARDPWKQQPHHSGLPKFDGRKSEKGKSSVGDEVKWTIAPNFENTGNVPTQNDMKIHNSTATDELRMNWSIDPNFKSMADHDARNSHVSNTQQNYYMSQQTQPNALSPPDIRNDGFADSAIQFAQNVQVNPQLLPSPKNSNSSGQIQDHEQPAMSNCKLNKETDDIPCQDLNFFPSTAVSSSDPVGTASVQDNEGSSSTNFPSGSRSSQVSIKASKTSEELKACTNELTPSEGNLNTGSCSSRKLQSGSYDPYHREPLDDKGMRMFKFALVEFVKKILKPTWKGGGLSLDAHRAVVKNVVDKVIRVLGSNVPRTRERIDQYLSFANDKLNKLTQDYVEMFINT